MDCVILGVYPTHVLQVQKYTDVHEEVQGQYMCSRYMYNTHVLHILYTLKDHTCITGVAQLAMLIACDVCILSYVPNINKEPKMCNIYSVIQ